MELVGDETYQDKYMKYKYKYLCLKEEMAGRGFSFKSIKSKSNKTVNPADIEQRNKSIIYLFMEIKTNPFMLPSFITITDTQGNVVPYQGKAKDIAAFYKEMKKKYYGLSVDTSQFKDRNYQINSSLPVYYRCYNDEVFKRVDSVDIWNKYTPCGKEYKKNDMPLYIPGIEQSPVGQSLVDNLRTINRYLWSSSSKICITKNCGVNTVLTILQGPVITSPHYNISYDIIDIQYTNPPPTYK